jgi:hypothetical protein
MRAERCTVGNVHVLATSSRELGPLPKLRASNENVISITRRCAVSDEERAAGVRRNSQLILERWAEALMGSQALRDLEAQCDREFWAYVERLRDR